MDIEKKLPTRKNTRLQVFDYNIPTAYFVTICTAHKKQILSNIVGGDVLDAPQSDDVNVAKVELLKCGKIAEKYILQLNDFYQDISVEKYVIMPDHIHILLRVLDAEVGGASRTSPPTRQHSKVTTFVSTFKRFLTKSLEKTFGNDLFTTTLFEIQRIMKNISITLSKIQCDGIINIKKMNRKKSSPLAYP